MANKKDVIAGASMAGFSALIYGMTKALPEGAGPGLAPASFPRALAVFIGALSIVLVVQGLAAGCKEDDDKPLFGPLFARMLLFFVALVIYILIIPKIGYTASTAAFLFSSFLMLSPGLSAGRVAAGLVFSIIAAAAVFYIFSIFLGVPLIEGPVDEFLHYTVFRAGV